jgi:hypothetical protein
MKTTLIAIASLLVIGAVALVLILTKSSDAPATTSAGPPRGSATVVTSEPRQAPALPATTASGGSAVASADGTYPKEYMVGDVRVRDHRSGNNKPLDLPPNMHPAESRELPSELTHDISQQVRRQLFECAAAVPKDAKHDKPKLEGQLTVAIKDHKLSITNMALQIRDIDGPSADAVKQCVQEKSAAFTSDARDQADVDNYGIAITFAIP